MSAVDPEDWRRYAECRDVDPDVFFPESADLAGVKAAKAICAVCPVRAECLDHAIVTQEWYGIWGGLSARQRQRDRQAHTRQRANARDAHAIASLGPNGASATVVATALDMTWRNAFNLMKRLEFEGHVTSRREGPRLIYKAVR